LKKICNLSTALNVDLKDIIKSDKFYKKQGAQELSAALWNYLSIPVKYESERIENWKNLETIALNFGVENTIKKLFPKPVFPKLEIKKPYIEQPIYNFNDYGDGYGMAQISTFMGTKRICRDCRGPYGHCSCP